VSEYYATPGACQREERAICTASGEFISAGRSIIDRGDAFKRTSCSRRNLLNKREPHDLNEQMKSFAAMPKEKSSERVAKNLVWHASCSWGGHALAAKGESPREEIKKRAGSPQSRDGRSAAHFPAATVRVGKYPSSGFAHGLGGRVVIRVGGARGLKFFRKKVRTFSSAAALNSHAKEGESTWRRANY
jgi:hypothetical protein